MRELIVERLGLQGDGLADGVRVPGALPGERVRGPVSRGVLAPAEILDRAADRVDPPCPSFGRCGGCALQHASDAFVAAWKRGTVLRALAARGLEAEVGPTETSPPGSRRRATLTGLRTRAGAVVGFHGRRSGEVAAPEGCLVLRPEIRAALPELGRLVEIGAARDRELRLTVALSETGLDVAAEGGRPLDAVLRGALAAAAEALDLARLAWDGEPVAQRRPPWLVFGRARVVPPPGAFLQATAEAEAALAEAARAAVGPARRVIDLFSGCGTFALRLAEGSEVHAVEADRAMLAALDAGWRGAGGGLRRVSTEARDLFRRPLLAPELARFDAAVIDPPRAGAEAQARALAASRVPRIAAISCNPVTFARDAAILTAGGYRMGPVRVIDQFRWSGHVEIAAGFTR